MKYFRNTRTILLMLIKTWDGQDERLDICPVCSTEPAPNYYNPTHENNHHLIIGSGADISQDACLWSPHASSRPHWGWRGLCWSCWRWWGRARAPLGSKSLATDRRHRSPGVKLRQATYWQCKSVSINEALYNDFAYDRTSFSFWPIFLGPPNTCEKTETWMNIFPILKYFFKAKRADWWKLLTFIFNARSPPHSWSAIARLLK